MTAPARPWTIREAEAAERQRAEAAERERDEARAAYDSALILSAADDARQRARIAELEAREAELEAALRLHVDVYGGADHDAGDCDDYDTCLQHQADAAANAALDAAEEKTHGR